MTKKKSEEKKKEKCRHLANIPPICIKILHVDILQPLKHGGDLQDNFDIKNFLEPLLISIIGEFYINIPVFFSSNNI